MIQFSSRLPWHSSVSELARETQSARDGALDLTISNPTDARLIYPPELLRNLSTPAALSYRPDAAGMKFAREAISRFYYNGRVHPDEIILTASTSEAYSWLFKLLC